MPAATSWATPTGQALACLDSRATESDALEAEVLTDTLAIVSRLFYRQFFKRTDLITLGNGNDTVAFGVSPRPATIGNETSMAAILPPCGLR